MVPLLPLATQLSMREVIGTSLLTVCLVSFANVYRFHAKALVEWRIGITAGSFAAFGSFVAATLTGYVPEYILHFVMFFVLVQIAYITLRGPKKNGKPVESYVGIGLASGLIAGFTGIGGGVLMTPMLGRLKGMLQARVVPTSNLAIGITSLAGAFALVIAGLRQEHGSIFGLVRLDLALTLFIGAQITAYFGRKYQHRLDPKKRDWLIGLLLLGLCFKTLLSGLRSAGML